MKIDLGGGKCPKPGYINVDYFGDIAHDLNKFPYPIENNSVSEVYSRHCFEHLNDFMRTVAELYRISKPGATWDIIVPHYSNPFTHIPGHKLYYCSKSFEYIQEEEVGQVILEKVKTELYFYPHGKVKNKLLLVLGSVMELIANRNIMLYELIFSRIIPAYEIRFVMKVRK